VTNASGAFPRIKVSMDGGAAPPVRFGQTDLDQMHWDKKRARRARGKGERP